MYAIVDIAGQQFKVERGRRIFVHRLQANEGADVEFDKVMLIENEGKISVGSPLIDGAKVAATVLSHAKGDKVIIFKKKRRKGYQKWNGHRQQFSEIIIHGILGKGETLKEKFEVKVHAPKVKKEEEVVAEVHEPVVEEKPVKKTRKKKES